jgi:4-amino-4-deoxy-L-arabinose transferase-like glycosyltransferase
MLAPLTARITRALDRLADALTDPARAGRTALALAAAYVAVWTLYGVIAKSSQDVHYDMGEAVIWSREALAGTPKHPPLSAWIVRGWFSVLPQADWAYYLLGIVLAAIALAAAWNIAGHYLSPAKRAAGIALLTLVPFYNFHALKYNANVVIVPLWALATWAFLRSYETRKPLPAALAGLAAAAAMLGKYWSVMLLAGLAAAVLTDTRRLKYLHSAAPWVTAAVGFAALVPYLLWLYDNASTFAYALESHPGIVRSALCSGLSYVGGAMAYAVLPLIITAAVVRPTRMTLADTFWPPQPERRFVVIAFVAPLILPLAAAVAAKSIAVSLWSIGSMTLLPIVLLSSPSVDIPRAALRRILGIAIAAPLAALLASPIVAAATHRKVMEKHAAYYRLVAQAVEQEWRRATDAPLGVYASYDNLMSGASFYFTTPPKTLEIARPSATPWTTQEDISRRGIAMACPFSHEICMNALEARAAAAGARAKRTTVDLSRPHFGIAGKPERFAIVVVPPG